MVSQSHVSQFSSLKSSAGSFQGEINHMTNPPSISASISYSIYHWGLLWPASCDAVIISEYISVELYNAFTSLILKALCVIETVSHRLLTKSPARHELAGRLGERRM
ncbi:hypothetical protein QQF64_006111 [Cirrhinus molitorella]|uniref:Uncharacterized protein n=1 Tax=Cirrhinus molitorella TaxID=172907 RepID=A0ABR3ME38_9TELE